MGRAYEHFPMCLLLRSTREVKCGYVWMPSVATCNRAWLWHPEDGELCRSLRCHWMLVPAFMNDQVDLVSA